MRPSKEAFHVQIDLLFSGDAVRVVDEQFRPKQTQVCISQNRGYLGQSPTPIPHSAGLSIHWRITLRGTSAANWASAEYTFLAPPPQANKHFDSSKFIVEAYTSQLPDGTKLNVFIGPSPTPSQPYGKLVGTIVVSGGSGALVLFDARTPMVFEIGYWIATSFHQRRHQVIGFCDCPSRGIDKTRLHGLPLFRKAFAFHRIKISNVELFNSLGYLTFQCRNNSP
jgi:hypothetical protein